jgi:molybdopterin-containing oxidoreductase family iron-sulfur binding subunit
MGTRTAIQVLGLSVADPNQLTPDELNQIALAGGRTVTVSYRGGQFTGPIWVQPGLPENTIVLTLGYGRSAAGRVGTGLGFNVYPIRTSDSLWFGGGAAVQSTGQRVLLVSTQLHWTTQERDIVRMGTLAEFQQDPKSITKREYEETYGGYIQLEDGKIKPNLGGQPYINLYPETPPANLIAPNQWAMVVNLNACIGCNSCAVACQSENNIPIVGKDQVAVHREMNWIRIDRYFGGEDLNNPVVMQQPVMCMQCETAPCEVVCPVAATVHDNEGLNNMVYNRCVGTKYCSNNCPYKVRRFNFLQYSDTETNSYKLMRNPEVTVRNRGVMEKCTYCVQRIAKARQDAKVAAVNSGEAGRVYAIADGTIVTACEAACPTEAITFGDKADANSRVAKLIKEPHNYSMLDFLNTKSRTTYLAKVTNHNPELEGQA